MPFRLLITIVLLIQIAGVPLNTFQSEDAYSSPNANNDNVLLYMPIITQELPMQVVITGRDFVFDIPPYSYVNGYILNTSEEPLYEASLLVTLYDSSAATETRVIRPFFTATLPGQPNPFGYTAFGTSEHAIYIGAVTLNTARYRLPDDPTYAALEITNYITETNQITGTVKNSSDKSVKDARVVIFYEDGKCEPVDASLITTTLKPGESTQFNLLEFLCMQSGKVPHPVAQGTVLS